MNGKFFKNVEFAKAMLLKDSVDYAKGQIVSKTLVQTESVSITLFSFDAGEEISSHSASGDALVYISEGKVNITIGENDPITAVEGNFVVMPANVPHALKASEKFKMMLVVVKG